MARKADRKQKFYFRSFLPENWERGWVRPWRRDAAVSERASAAKLSPTAASVSACLRDYVRRAHAWGAVLEKEKRIGFFFFCFLFKAVSTFLRTQFQNYVRFSKKFYGILRKNNNGYQTADVWYTSAWEAGEIGGVLLTASCYDTRGRCECTGLKRRSHVGIVLQKWLGILDFFSPFSFFFFF